MKRQKKPCINKLSVAMPEASLAPTRKKLEKLSQLTKESNAIAEALSQTVKGLRQIPKSDSEQFIFTTIEENQAYLKHAFNNSTDVIFQEFKSFSGLTALVVYIEGLVNHELLGRDIIGSFTKLRKANLTNNPNPQELTKHLPSANIKETQSMSTVIDEVLNGNTLMFVDGMDTAFIIDAKGWDKRSVTEPDVEAVIRGPREGFVESIRSNTALVRRKIKNPNLIFENLTIGKQTKTIVYIGYIDGIVNEEVLKEVRKRLNEIDTDSILETGYIEQFIEDSPFSPLATVGNTQKPDVVAAKLLEGRVAVFCDGTPHVLTIPNLFVEAVQTAEDYYMRPFLASMLRIFRIVSVVIGVLTPGLYVALQTYHQEMIPTVLLLRMAGSMEGIPFPALAEALMMVVAFELLRESGTRLPRAVGSAISIVGALVVGEGAVNAGLVSAPVVIVIAITAVSSFIVPTLTEVMTLYRLLFLFLGGIMGLYGITWGIFVVMTHAVSLRSFGIPYISGIAAPLDKSSIKDYLLRFPLWATKLRPAFLTKGTQKKQGNTRGK